MGKIGDFLKTTVIGGFFVLLPLVVVMVLLILAMATVIKAIKPIMDKLSIEGVVGLTLVTLAVVLVILFFCFMTGLFVKMRLGSMSRQWLERVLLKRLPGYIMFKNLTKRIAGEGGIEFAPALIDLYGSEARALGFVIEEQGEGRFTVFVPISPTPTLGQVFLVPSPHVQKLEAKFVDVVNSLTQWGIESHKFLRHLQE
jgi:uncharacterized membrane protein